MLVFFHEDKTTSVIDTNKVKEILGENSKLEEGCDVLVQCEKTNYEANVIKLHGKKEFKVLSIVTVMFFANKILTLSDLTLE